MGDSQCATCADGTYADDSGDATVCTACTDVTNCDVAETCTSASNSQCATCADGYSANNDGAATVCNRDLLGPIACPTSRATQYHVCEGGTEVHTSSKQRLQLLPAMRERSE